MLADLVIDKVHLVPVKEVKAEHNHLAKQMITMQGNLQIEPLIIHLLLQKSCSQSSQIIQLLLMFGHSEW